MGPEEQDFAIYIDFDENESNPQRVFQAIEEMIGSFQDLDRLLAQSIDGQLKHHFTLQRIEGGSIYVWLKSALELADDQALRDVDWKPQIGKYLVKAKYKVVEFANQKIEADKKKRLDELRNDLKELAAETDVRHVPDYAPVPSTELLETMSSFSAAKSRLSSGDKLKIVSSENEIDVDVKGGWSSEEMRKISVKETINHPPSEMKLLVKKPDYIGKSQWEFRHGKIKIFARIDHEEWREDFQSRKKDVRPGDYLRCLVAREVQYGYDNEVIGECFTVLEVLGVEEMREEQLSMID